MRMIKRYSLLTYFGLTFVISLTGFILDIPELWVFGPSTAGVILVQLTYRREERRDFWRCVLDFKRISVGWYLLILLVVPTVLAASILLDVLLGGSFPEMPILNLTAILIHFSFNLTLGLASPFSERVFLFFGILLALVIGLVIRRRSISPIVAIPRPVGPLVE